MEQRSSPLHSQFLATRRGTMVDSPTLNKNQIPKRTDAARNQKMSSRQRRASIMDYFTSNERKTKQQTREEAIGKLIDDKKRWNGILKILKANGVCTNQAAQEILNIIIDECGVTKTTQETATIPEEKEVSSEAMNQGITKSQSQTLFDRLIGTTRGLMEGLDNETVEKEEPKRKQVIYKKSVRNLSI